MAGPLGETSVNPTDEHYRVIQQQLKSLAVARQDLERLKGAGINCGETPEVCQHLIDQYSQRKATLFPTRP